MPMRQYCNNTSRVTRDSPTRMAPVSSTRKGTASACKVIVMVGFLPSNSQKAFYHLDSPGGTEVGGREFLTPDSRPLTAARATAPPPTQLWSHFRFRFP